ncbi:hypothetical protein POM88_026224 [Heracleum sosnowskyi]|uniref:Transposase (putative) gypsy type domain-containing protein n=1 Tax=Heracleum sosnowskyi TaxID=360622 RepID=A0AAD8I8P5_9APIA|nr:hypothetical protein POM88_026224 [Heracleum sosnowskyi]
MDDRATQRLQKMNQASKRGIITIHSSYMSLQDMISERGDEYPSMSHLDSFDCSNKFHEVDKIRDYKKMYRVKTPLRLVPAGPGDRSCHWRPDALCTYKDAIVAGLRFPFHEFIPKLLAYVRISPCQLTPNAWRIIICFMVLCLKNKFPLSVSLFRNIFQFKNSSAVSPGWVYLNHRASTPSIFHPKSIPDNNPKWKIEFMYLVWGGDWGTLFRRSFSRVSDGSPNDIVLTDEEAYAYDELTKELADAQAELVALMKSKDDFIDEYLDSQEYKDLIGKHDELLFPVQFTKGWDGALTAVLEKNPDSFSPSDFPSPRAHTPLEWALAGEDDMDEDDRILDPGHSSPPG